ncbi:DAHL domain-containing protein [Arenicella xantha]|uniref:histidine kinase n=1 Tax=Arenicella xantha TaxID=644221 RepID=A0A395JPL9_9GAMM|nr:DAHL domain-containing protein [Arenicella xantha]RBP53591.1 histidine kinase/DNA gyrase B/HSP90-like ATPase [Arenicella xantha]
MKNSILFAVIILIAIAGGAGLFYVESRLPNDVLTNQDVNSQLLKLDGLDSNINELALRSRTNIDTNYDMLVRSTVALERAVSELSESHFNESKISGSLLEKRFNTFKTSVEVKVDQVEDFKSSNSVLRNSETYIPLVGAQLTESAQQAELTDVSDLYKQVVIDMLEFTRQGSRKPIADVIDYRNEILATEAVMPEAVGIKVLEFANHVATAIDSKTKTDQYLGKLLNSKNGSQQVEEISNAWNLWQLDNNNTREVLRYYIIAYVLVMMGLLGFLFFRLRNLYKHLDREVEAKTAEVKVAYDELRVSERQLEQTEKMASLGQLVAGVAHEVNTPLGYTLSNLETIKAKFSGLMPVLSKVDALASYAADPQRDKSALSGMLKDQISAYRQLGDKHNPESMNLLLDDASEGLREIKGIVASLTSFSHESDAPTENVDINERIEYSLKISTPTIANRTITTNLGSPLPNISGVPDQLVRVFTNIISNAAHATDADAGEIKVTTKFGNGLVQAIFQDNGRGIDPESLKRIVEPFFTTKQAGEGTGLGLAIADRIIQSHQGSIRFDSEVGTGTTVTVSFPVAD